MAPHDPPTSPTSTPGPLAGQRTQAAALVVAGAPGAGKTTVAALLAARLDPRPALLDKDTVYGPFVAALLRGAGRPPGEREGAWYDRHIKVHEYAGLTATAREIRAHGCPVLLVGPFTGQIRDPAAWAAWCGRLGGGEVRLVWVGCTPDVLRRRLIARGSDRDGAKLEAYAAFVDRMRPGTPPPVPHLALDNSAEDGPDAPAGSRLADRVQAVACRIQSRYVWSPAASGYPRGPEVPPDQGIER